VALTLGAICLVALVAGLLGEGGATLVGVAIVAAVLSLATLADATLKRVAAKRNRLAGG
jgi:hypothetical protein